MPRYMFRPEERIKELNPYDGALPGDCEVTYSFNNGYEKFTIKREGSGGYEYQGSYHPEGYCEGNGICKFCGRTLEFDDLSTRQIPGAKHDSPFSEIGPHGESLDIRAEDYPE